MITVSTDVIQQSVRRDIVINPSASLTDTKQHYKNEKDEEDEDEYDALSESELIESATSLSYDNDEINTPNMSLPVTNHSINFEKVDVNKLNSPSVEKSALF